MVVRYRDVRCRLSPPADVGGGGVAVSEVGEQGGGGEEAAIEERDGKRNKIMEWKKRSTEQSRVDEGGWTGWLGGEG